MRYGEAADRAGIIAGKQHFPVSRQHTCIAIRQLQSRLERIMNPASGIVIFDNTVHHHINSVAPVLIQLNIIFQQLDFSIDSDPDIAFLQKLVKPVFERALLSRTIGAMMVSLVRSSRFIRVSVISCTVWPVIGMW